MKILVAVYSPVAGWTIPEASVVALRAMFPEHDVAQAGSDVEMLARIPDAEVVVASRLRPEHLDAAARLRWVHSPAAGVGNMLFPAMIDSPILLTNSRGLASRPIAEHVIAVTLAMLRDLPLACLRQTQHVWAQDELQGRRPPPSLADCRVLVVGLGAIGGEVARLAAAFGAEVVGIRRRPGNGHGAAAAVLPPERLPDELPRADVVVIAAPQTADTRGLIGARELSRLKEGAVLVNVSRGKLVDESALAVALATGRIRAALDVFEHEPLAPESPLWDSPNILVTPHVAGHFAGYWPKATQLFADNLRRFVAGEPLVNAVDKKAGY